MTKAFLSRLCISTCLLMGQLPVASCSNGRSGDQEQTATGTLAMPLVTTVGEHVYRLQASLNVYGPTYIELNTSDDPNETVLKATLMTGYYTAYLNNWTLERKDDAGEFKPVNASLVSNSYANFDIYNQSSTTITFQFETDGVVVVIGNGQLNVTFGVKERAPACTPLGNDCPEGSWCPPPGLTGEGVSCVSAGFVPLGSACAMPSDCVANASCFDFGAGPLCASLCSAEEIGTTCSKGGQCTQTGSGYGVCVPPGGTLPGVGGGGGVAGGGGLGGGGAAGRSGTTGHGGKTMMSSR